MYPDEFFLVQMFFPIAEGFLRQVFLFLRENFRIIGIRSYIQDVGGIDPDMLISRFDENYFGGYVLFLFLQLCLF